MEETPFEVSLDAWNNSRFSAEKMTVRLLLEYYQLALYTRSQIPEPVQLMHRKLQRKKTLASSASNTNSQKTKHAELQYSGKCIQLLKNLEDLRICLEELVQKCDLVEALVTVGSTPVSIKEVFTFKSTLKGDLSSENNIYNSEQLNFHARKFCMLMVQSPLCTGGALPLTNTRIFLRTPNRSAAAGCTPWPNLRWSANKHKVSAKINFYASANPAMPLSESFLASADQLRIIDQNKENHSPQTNLMLKSTFKKAHCFTKTSSTDNSTSSEKELPSNNIAFEEGRKVNAPRKKRLSAAEVLDGILAEDETNSIKGDEATSDISLPEVEDCGIWLELPVVIKGFKF